MMLRLTAIKFGAQAADSLAAILGTHPTAERMERVGVAIMECDNCAELLARCSEAGIGRLDRRCQQPRDVYGPKRCRGHGG